MQRNYLKIAAEILNSSERRLPGKLKNIDRTAALSLSIKIEKSQAKTLERRQPCTSTRFTPL